MAVLTDRTTGRKWLEPAEIRDRLAERGIWYRRFELAESVPPGAPDEEVLAAFAAPIAELRRERAYPAADVVEVRPDVPGLGDMLDRFAREHWHEDDEIRFVVAGRGMFHLHFPDDAVLGVEVGRGDLLYVPARTLHWFHVGPELHIRAVRLFTDSSGWVPHYTGSGIEERFPPEWSPVAPAARG